MNLFLVSFVKKLKGEFSVLNHLNERLMEIKEKQRKKRKLKKQLEAYRQELSGKQQIITGYKESLEKEQKDVKKLTSLSLTNLLFSIAGKS